MAALLVEPAPYGPAAIEALQVWRLLGNELRLEALPTIMAMEPGIDLVTIVPLLKTIDDVLRETP